MYDKFLKNPIVLSNFKTKGRIICKRLQNGKVKFTPYGRRLRKKVLQGNGDHTYKNVFNYLTKTKNGYEL